MYNYKSGNTLDFRSVTNPKYLFDGIKGVNILLIDERSQQRPFESNLGNIRKGGNGSEHHYLYNNIINNLFKCYNTGEEVIQLFDDYVTLPESKYRAMKEERM